MARPKKEPDERKNAELRIPLTETQKDMVSQVAQLEGVDMAAWARPIILQAARERLGGNGAGKGRKT